jgi:hypothetical protein
MDSSEIGKSDFQKPVTGTWQQGDASWTLPEAMTGRASPAKAAVGDKSVLHTSPACPVPARHR